MIIDVDSYFMKYEMLKIQKLFSNITFSFYVLKSLSALILPCEQHITHYDIAT